jgi:hypothetical protein
MHLRTPSEQSSSDVDLDQLFDAEWCKNPDLYHDYFDGVNSPASVDSEVSDHCACESSHPTPEVTEPEENPAVAKQSEEAADAPESGSCKAVGRSGGGLLGDSWDITSSEDEEETEMTQAVLPPPQVVNQDLPSPVSTRSTAAPVTPVVSLVAYPPMSSTKRAVERSRSPRFAKVVVVQKHAPSDIAWWTEPVEVVNRVGTTLHIRNRVTYKLDVVYVGFVCVAAANATCASCALEPNCGDCTNNRFNIRFLLNKERNMFRYVSGSSSGRQAILSNVRQGRNGIADVPAHAFRTEHLCSGAGTDLRVFKVSYASSTMGECQKSWNIPCLFNKSQSNQ